MRTIVRRATQPSSSACERRARLSWPRRTWEKWERRTPAVPSEGKELPLGHGTAKEGAEIFAKKCALCHGKDGQGGAVQRLVSGNPGNPHRGPFKDTEKSATSYYPYPTIAWDYINRAMPANKPGSLTPDEVYALVAFLFYRNGIIQENDVLDAKTLPKIEMPNRDGFVPAKPVWPPNPKKPSWY
jgi:S-disulfanyl-L-cysteine oxidoreductase SoxD